MKESDLTKKYRQKIWDHIQKVEENPRESSLSLLRAIASTAAVDSQLANLQDLYEKVEKLELLVREMREESAHDHYNKSARIEDNSTPGSSK